MNRAYGVLDSIWSDLTKEIELKASLGKKISISNPRVKVFGCLDSELKPFLLIGSDKVTDISFKLTNMEISKKEINIKGVEKNFYYSIALGCSVNSYYFSTFCRFCEDILNEVQERKGTRTQDSIKKVYLKWKRFWAPVRERKIQPNWVLGLVGELLFIDNNLKKSEELFCFWKGPSGSPQDFISANNVGLEVKSTTLSEQIIRVSSLDQLEHKNFNSLFLLIYSLNRCALGQGVNLVSLISSIERKVRSDEELEIFWEKLAEADYNPIFEQLYIKYNFSIKEKSVYKIDDSFPCVTPSKLDNTNIASKINKMSYELTVDSEKTNYDLAVKKLLG